MRGVMTWKERIADFLPPEEIGFLDFGVPRSEIVLLDRMEASVYRAGGKVFKIYDGFMSHLINMDVLRRYQKLTKRTIEIVHFCPEIENDFGFRIKVVPIERTGKLLGKIVTCSISDFIPGKNIEEEWTKMTRQAKEELIVKFGRLNMSLREKLRDPHVRIDFNNAKFDETGKVVIVTDVCGEISRMNPNFIYEPAVFC